MFILGLIIGGLIGVGCMAACAMNKENDEINSMPKFIEYRSNSRHLDDFKMASFKYNMERILNNDINFYQKLYEKNRNQYYLGRIDECKFLLGLVKGGINNAGQE